MEEIKKNDVFDDISLEMFEELKNEKKLNIKELKNEVAAPRNILLRLCEKMLGKLVTSLQIKITISWRGRVLFEYVIPKN